MDSRIRWTACRSGCLDRTVDRPWQPVALLGARNRGLCGFPCRPQREGAAGISGSRKRQRRHGTDAASLGRHGGVPEERGLGQLRQGSAACTGATRQLNGSCTMNKRIAATLALILGAASLTASCTVFDTVGDWFDAGPKKSKLRGERISVMSADTALRLDETLKSVDVVLPPPYKNAEWPEPGGYASNAMYHLEAKGPLRQIWAQDAGKGSDRDSRLTAAPVVADGKIFVLDSEAHVFAFDAQSGNPLWDASIAPPSEGRSWLGWIMFQPDTSIDPTKGFGGGVAFDDGKVFVTSGFGDVVALDAKSGKKLWTQSLGVPIVNAPTANGGRVFVSTQENHFYT